MERHTRFILDSWERVYEDKALCERHQRRLVIADASSLWHIALQEWPNSIYASIPGVSLRV